MTDIPNDENYDDLDGKVQIFSNTDDRLKFLGTILTKDSSRNILLLLIEKEMTANEIATKMNLSLPLALHHINQMINAEIVVICKTTTNSKNHPMKYYTAKSGIIILPEKAVEKARNSKSLSRSLKEIMKFAVIGIAGLVTWLYDFSFLYTLNEDQFNQIPVDVNSLELPLIIIIIGLIIERIFSLKKKEKRNSF